MKIVSSKSLKFLNIYFIRQYLGSLGMEHVVSESCFKGTILQRNYRKKHIGITLLVFMH